MLKCVTFEKKKIVPFFENTGNFMNANIKQSY